MIKSARSRRHKAAQMDHLSYPLSHTVDPPAVPLLCDGEAEYDGLPFSTYPLRKNWTDTPGGLEWLRCSDEELAKRVQLWLYFGLLSEFCGRVIPRASLRAIDQTTKSPRLCTTQLSQLLKAQKLQWPTRNSAATRQLLARAMRLSEMVEGIIVPSSCPLLLISCSVRVLLQTLNCAQGLQITTMTSNRRYQAGRRWPLKFSRGLVDEWKIFPPKAIKYKMADLGWCPAQIADFSCKYSCTMLHYISGLPTNSGVSHTQCSDSRCVAFNIDERHYATRHNEDCGSNACAFVDATSVAVASIIEDNFGIPLVSCSVSSNGMLQLKIIRATPSSKYIAISHVWSGGLGNPTNNGLPECQVRQILYRIRKLRGLMSIVNGMKDAFASAKPTLFWMDTFCIPVGDIFRPSRKKSINAMAEIYAGADAVLVLDPGLQYLSYKNLEAEQALAHVLCSSWMSRCWTLQEASLSKSWYIQFKDSVVHIVDAMERLKRSTKIAFIVGQGKLKPSMQRALVEELSSFLIDMGEVRYQRRGRYSRAEIWNLKQLESHQAYAFAATWNNFLGRTTSKIQDLHQILALMEDMSVSNVQGLPVQDRMKAILKCHASLPIDLLFCPCERIRDSEFFNRWVPESPQGQRLDDSNGIMKVFTDYLFISKEMTSEHLQIYLVSSNSLGSNTFRLDLPELGQLWVEMHSKELSQHVDVENNIMCLIFPIKDTQSKGDVTPESRGARFFLRKQEGSDLYLTYDGSFLTYAFDRTNDGPVSATYPFLLVEPADVESRVFIDCGESTTRYIRDLNQD